MFSSLENIENLPMWFTMKPTDKGLPMCYWFKGTLQWFGTVQHYNFSTTLAVFDTQCGRKMFVQPFQYFVDFLT